MRARPAGVGTGDPDAGESSETFITMGFMTIGFMATDNVTSYDDMGRAATEDAMSLGRRTSNFVEPAGRGE